jgi:hypothetical protein
MFDPIVWSTGTGASEATPSDITSKVWRFVTLSILPTYDPSLFPTTFI